MRWSLFLAAVLAVSLAAGRTYSEAKAQAFGPPMTVFGSVADSAGTVPADLTVEAYVGDKVCGKGKTQFTGDGAGRVTVYYADVVSREQTAGCGATGTDVRIRIGDRFATQTVKWQAGPQQLDVVFGSATPAPIPTFTPTPTRTPTATRAANAPTPSAAPTKTAAAGTPGGTVTAAGTPGTATTGTTGTTGASGSATPGVAGTIRGGLGTPSVPGTGGGGDGDDGGFPVWAAVLLVVAGIALVGGGVGFLMAQNRREKDAA
jgi:hypothetical protein